MGQEIEETRAAVENSERKPDLAANYGTLGIKAVIAACLALTQDKRVATSQQVRLIRPVHSR